MSDASEPDPQDDPNALQSGEPLSSRASRLATWGLVGFVVLFVAYVILSATVWKDEARPGVSFDEIRQQPVYVHQPPESEDRRFEEGEAGAPGQTAQRWVVREFGTKLTPDQTRDWYLRQFGAQYRLATTTTPATYLLSGAMPLSEATRATPPVISTRIRVARRPAGDRTIVLVSLQSSE